MSIGAVDLTVTFAEYPISITRVLEFVDVDPFNIQFFARKASFKYSGGNNLGKVSGNEILDTKGNKDYQG